MPKWDNTPQGEPGWLKARQGCLTASRMAEAMSYLKNGKESTERLQLKMDLLAERMTDYGVTHYVNDAMRWGIEHESEARGCYEDETGNIVMACGLALHDTIEFFGASPDGLIGHDGLLEVKCPTSKTHLSWLMGGVVPEQHKPQMLAQLACTGRRYVDFISYDPRFKGDHRRMIKRFEPAPEEIAAVEAAAVQFLAELDAMFDLMTTGACE